MSLIGAPVVRVREASRPAAMSVRHPMMTISDEPLARCVPGLLGFSGRWLWSAVLSGTIRIRATTARKRAG
ncbi:hypothetical protein JMF97_18220 [Micromonospora fiedleri]|uniref:Uncharacterized protein n=1 Tax=Micromonospora fiedleri TaxID=1157498 RepID=A0ABS1UP30_9ACTN|nr:MULTISPECIES: hypothetical protein [Micromonospora]MBL6278097.1 hypothetical protein [Micromonospora fiedleri]WSK41201.1 hypothetical protein OG712_22165 [Micromonospora maris]